MNKIFLITYEYCPSELDKTVVIAKDNKQAFELVKKWYEKDKEEWDENDTLLLVSNKEELEEIRVEDDVKKCFIEEIVKNEGIIYSGFRCC